MVESNTIRIAIIGAGLQGTRYALSIKKLEDTQICVIADTDMKRASYLATEVGAEAVSEWEKAVNNPVVQAILVTTPPFLHAPVSIAAMKAGKHVLCEKPLAPILEEAQEMVQTATDNEVTLACAFNYRHHPGISQAKKWFDQGQIGELLFMRCRHGIIGRSGYEKEWRGKVELSGGGHLMEQGIHILDLFRWFAGDFQRVAAFNATSFWDMAPLEDNAFVLLETGKGQIASLHSSLTQWRNLFSFEVYGRDGYVQVEGLGGSYGTEKAILGRRDFDKPFSEEIIDYRGQDESFTKMWLEFASAVKGKSTGQSARAGYEALRLVQAIYDSARSGQMVQLSGFNGLSTAEQFR